MYYEDDSMHCFFLGHTNSLDEIFISKFWLQLILHVSSRLLDDENAAPSEGKIILVQAAGGISAGATASFVTTPLDTIKTRLQVISIWYSI